ncbi:MULTISPECIES: aminomethyltransferase family protein [Tenebrionibacter/Tenebrionicola group]|jgi:glycine cleavage system aminomethyltransferase T|uniref:Aminomethyltransferase family protein n=2 Tax=Tenebrionibacter/Tenebrionicola group TaxID=2969848 RepID=A0A8K0XXE2_9ENTR|nr:MULTISPECIES: aminomethyltransferase family protein [Tenebrionibacter/Tenebrionicola group]MBK4715277.1 aminomethyltransferase family protein [Tenebrionibacter intestinalis]MBV5096023.1 aminomethyltransferase family protein [Tenebrionicola larvae]
MSALNKLHTANNAKMGVYNGKTVPSLLNTPQEEYKAVRETALLVDYSHMSIVSVMGDDAWALVNHLCSADVSIIRDEQGMYSLVLNEDGTVWGDVYVLCTDEGYYILSENLPADEIVARLNAILENADELDIEETPEISVMDDQNWGAVLVEGPYSWEVLSDIYGFDIIGLPYHEYMNTDDGLMAFRCGKHGEFAYLLIGDRDALANVWTQLLECGEKFNLKAGGLSYQDIVRVENPCWEASIYADYSRSPVELQMQWAVQYDKEDFIGKDAVVALSGEGSSRKLVGIVPVAECQGIASDDKVLVDGVEVGTIVKGVYSPARQSFIALALIDSEYAYSDIDGFSVQTQNGPVAAKTNSVPFLYNFSMLVSPTEHSYIDAAKPKSAL